MEKERFYFEGVFYDSQEEFYKAVNNFINSQISTLSANRILQEMIENISINLSINCNDEKFLTNHEFSDLCYNFMGRMVREYRELVGKK